MADSSTVSDAKSSETAKPKRERRRRGSITAEDIISGAFELANEVSIGGLSMPLLARHLGVGVTSIYWYFRKKEELMDAMTDRATKQYHFVTPFVGDETWQDGLRNHFRKMRRVFQENPVLCDLILMRSGELSPEATHATIEKLETVVGTMVEAGFSSEDAFDVYLALSVHTRGSSILDHLNTNNVGEGNMRPTGVTTEQPLLLELQAKGHTIAGLNFEFTLEAIISRAEELLARDLEEAERGAS
jgi:AcrR family transcriptional regulator